MTSGVPIEGERGVGYIIRHSLELPPLRFTPLELKALQLGIKMVSAVADEEIASAANEASIKIMDALPYEACGDDTPVANIYFESDTRTRENLAIARDAINEKKKLELHYLDERDNNSERIIRPLGLEYWGKVWTLTAWCELRNDFRVFRVDRILSCIITNDLFKNKKGKTYQDYLNRFKAAHD